MKHSALLIAALAALFSLCVAGTAQGKPTTRVQYSIKKVVVNNQVISSTLKTIDGQIYVPLSDIIKYLDLTKIAQPNSQTIVLVSQKQSAVGATKTKTGGGKSQAFWSAAKLAVQALEALASATSSGVSYSSYGSRRGDAKIGLDKFVNEYGNDTPVAQKLQESMTYYETASTLWECYMTSNYRNSALPTTDEIVAAILQEHPDLKSDVYKAGDREFLNVDVAIGKLWDTADKTVKAARQCLPK